jgi:putative pyruvate formate lyase activating enzyme
MKVSYIGPHHGEEPPISGTRGSGTIFFTNCTMRCVYCQNYQISREMPNVQCLMPNEGELSDQMLKLQEQGCHNINLVSPTQYAKDIAATIRMAKNKGLKIPVVYNTNGYDRLDVLKLFDGLVDIYLPDIKYSDDAAAFELSGVKGYAKRNREAITEMFRQVGNLELDGNDIAKRGSIVRHLVLPNGLAGSYDSLKFLASLSKDIWLSIMAQYHPCYKADEHPKINRRITPSEYQQVLKWVEEFGFANVLAQELDSSEVFVPDFSSEKPFKI